MRDLNNMTQAEIEQIIFENASVSQLVGMLDNLTEEEVSALPSHPAWGYFDEYFKEWVWSTIDTIYLRNQQAQ